ncbi:MAG: HAMP domain-containing histidine kinase [Rhizobacter sp.]|nr:HAMP domain-containing histidine kinase [Chlorobiales bacterium]
MSTNEHSGELQEAPARRYGELIVYAAIFVALVSSLFIFNIFLSRRSQQDAAQLFYATRQQRTWQATYTHLYNVYLNLYAAKDVSGELKSFAVSVRKFDQLTTLIQKGGTVEYDGSTVSVEPLAEPRLTAIYDSLSSYWTPGRQDMLRLAADTERGQIDTILVSTMAEYAVRVNTPIIEATQNFVVGLGQLAEERVSNLQRIQIGALFLCLLVFALMAIRLTTSLRKRDSLIRENTRKILDQNELITQEKNKVDQLLVQVQSAQRHLVQSEKMSAIGQMVAGIAHELNTPIGYVSSNVALVQERFASISTLLENSLGVQESIFAGNLEEALAQMQHISGATNGTIAELQETVSRTDQLFTGANTGLTQMTNLVRSMRNFSRLDEAEKKQVDINEGIRSSMLMVGHMLKDKNVEVYADYGQLPLTDCYPAQLNQVFLNLIVNAIHAVEQRPDGAVEIKTISQDRWVVVQIKDNGTGIPLEARDKIFDPFFTTKPVGQGTGLGLSIAYDIISQHRGQITFDSEIGKGTTFTVKIPAVEFMTTAPA